MDGTTTRSRGASTSVVVGIDGSAGSRAARDVATAVARRRGAHLLMVHVVPQARARDAWAAAAARLTRRGEELLESARADVAATDGPLVVETALWTGRVAALLTEAVSGDDVLVVGRRATEEHPHRWGSVSLAVAARSPCPVVVVPAGQDRRPRHGRVVVGLDGTARSLPALEAAVREAEERDAELLVVHCWDPLLVDVPESEELAELWRQPGERAVSEELAGLSREHPDLRVRTEVVHGPAAAGLLHAAQEADLVVLGVRGGGGMAGLPVGSVALAVAGSAPCPVELVRRGRRSAVRGRAARGQQTLYEDARSPRR